MFDLTDFLYPLPFLMQLQSIGVVLQLHPLISLAYHILRTAAERDKGGIWTAIAKIYNAGVVFYRLCLHCGISALNPFASLPLCLCMYVCVRSYLCEKTKRQCDRGWQK